MVDVTIYILFFNPVCASLSCYPGYNHPFRYSSLTRTLPSLQFESSTSNVSSETRNTFIFFHTSFLIPFYIIKYSFVYQSRLFTFDIFGWFTFKILNVLWTLLFKRTNRIIFSLLVSKFFSRSLRLITLFKIVDLLSLVYIKFLIVSKSVEPPTIFYRIIHTYIILRILSFSLFSSFL